MSSGSNGTVQPFGSSFALLDLGLPTSGSFDVNTKFQYNNWYNAIFIQDGPIWTSAGVSAIPLGFCGEASMTSRTRGDKLARSRSGSRPSRSSSK